MSLNLNRRRKEFGQHLRDLRKERKLTCAELGKRAGLELTTVAAIERGQRQAGQSVSRRLADALGLVDEARTAFIVSALATTRRDLVPEELVGFDPDIFRPLWMALGGWKVIPQTVKKMHVYPAPNKHLPAAFRKAWRALAVRMEKEAKAIRQSLAGQHSYAWPDLVLELFGGQVVVLKIMTASEW